MDRATAKARLSNMVAATSRPVLSDDDLELLLNQHQVRDVNGAWPADTAWDPTWDLNAAAAEGWGWKAGKVAGDFTFSADGASYSKADVITHCAEREQFYAAKSRGNMEIGRYGYLLRDDYSTEELIP